MSRFLRNAVAYSGANMISQAAKVGQELVLRRLLAPSVLGVWNLATVVQGFGATFDVGMGAAAEREIPLFEGAGRLADATTARSTAFWSKMAQTALIATGVVAYAVLLDHAETPGGRAGFLAGAVLVVAYSITELCISFHQASQRYVALSRVTLVASVLAAVLLCVGAWLGQPWSIVTAGLLAAVAQASILTMSARMNGVRIERIWQWPVFRRLLGYGLPLRVVDYPLSLFPVVDSMFVARFLGLEALAVYATAKVIFAQSVDIPSRFGNVFISRLFNQAGADRSRAELADDLARFLAVSHLCLIPCVLLAVSCFAPFALGLLLPKYVAAVPVLKILLLAIYFVPQTTLVRNFWLLDRRLVRIGVVNLVSFAGLLSIGALVLSIRGTSMSSVAMTFVAGNAFLFLCLMATIGREIWGFPRMLRILALTLLSFVSTGAVLHAALSDPAGPGLALALRALAVNLAKGAALLAPMVAFAIWRTGVYRYVTRRSSGAPKTEP